MLRILITISFSIFWLANTFAQNVVWQKKWYDVEKKRLKEEYQVLANKKNILNGFYNAYFQNGNRKVEGLYVNNLPEGVWKYFYENGKMKSSGFYKNGVSDSKWTYFYESGLPKMKGKLVNDKKDSLWTFYYENGFPQSEGYYENDTAIAEWKYFYDDGKLKSKTYLVAGAGWVKEYYPSGNIKSEGLMQNNLADSIWTHYHENGAIKARGFERKGLKEGEWVYFFSNGVLSASGYYAKNKQVGHWKYFYENTNVSLEGDLKSGVKEGEWFSYYQLGALKSETVYTAGDGPYKEYYPNNKLKITGFIKQEKAEGTWLYYDENGKQEGICNFKEGEGWYTGFFPNGKLKMEGLIKDGVRVGSWKIYDSDQELAGYFKAFYDKEPLEQDLKIQEVKKDTLLAQIKTPPKKEMNDGFKPKKTKRKIFFNPSLNRYNSLIISINPFAVMRSSLPFYLEYYNQERFGFELMGVIHKVPFFDDPQSLPANKVFSNGSELAVKLKFYKRNSDLGMVYFAHSIRYKTIEYGSYVAQNQGDVPELYTINQQSYNYSFQIGDRFVRSTDKPGITFDIYTGLGLGYRILDKDIPANTFTSKVFYGIVKKGVYIPFNFGFNVGYIF